MYYKGFFHVYYVMVRYATLWKLNYVVGLNYWKYFEWKSADQLNDHCLNNLLSSRTRWCIPNLEYFSSIFNNPLTHQRAWVVATASSSTTSELLKERTMLLVSCLNFCWLLEPKSAISSIPGMNAFSNIWISNTWTWKLRMFVLLSFVFLA